MRSAATWLITLLVVSLATVEMPHLTGGHHDADFDLIVVAHDASAHHISDGQAEPARQDHCLACHWGRSFKPGAETSALGVPVGEATVASLSEDSLVSGRAPVAQPPLRSPPV